MIKEQQFSALQKTAQDVSDTSKGKAILLEKINKLQLNTGWAKVKISYQDYTKKNKTVEVALNSVEEAWVVKIKNKKSKTKHKSMVW